MYEAGDVRVEDVPDAKLIEDTDAVVRVTRAAICGSDLWPYKSTFVATWYLARTTNARFHGRRPHLHITVNQDGSGRGVSEAVQGRGAGGETPNELCRSPSQARMSDLAKRFKSVLASG